VIYLALAPKSNSVYISYGKVKADIKEGKIYPVPLQIRNAPTKLMKELEYGRGYRYAHDYDETTTSMECMPSELLGRRYYIPKEIGFERELKKRIEYFQKLKEKMKN
jgi:putative ATPase